MKSPLVVLVTSFLLSGCSTCFERTIYEPKNISENEIKLSVEEFNYTIGAVIELGESATLRVSECTLKPDGVQIEPNEVCVTVRLDELHTFQFIMAEIEVYSYHNSGKVLSMSDLEYMIFTSYKSDGSSVSDSSSTPPTTVPIKQRIESYGTGQHVYYTFEPTALFKGASSKWNPPTVRVFSKDATRRAYTSSVKLPSSLGDKFYIKLPNVLVDSKEYTLPTLEFNLARKTFCRPSV